MGGAISNLFCQVGDDYNRVYMHNINFKVTQSIRLVMILASLAVWGTLVYIWAKSVLSQLVIFSFGLWILALSLTALSSGREVCEKKMVDKIKQQKLNEGLIQPEQVDEIELPSEEKSNMWKRAIIFYSVATPLVLAVAI